MRITQHIILSIVLSLQLVSSQYLPKPWPTYSSDNMPRTGFSCQGKILGGYYADSETQCQMFHVCVKVSGVGIKDFRFLCPNGTAFDQEAQICADWGDVDCEQSTLYYSSDNFDLYRLGSGFESKRAPVAEDEQPFHLQNAESNDFRRTPQQPHNIQSFKRNNVQNYNDDSNSYSNKQNYAGTRNAPKARSTTTTTTTTSTTEATYQADRRGDDEIFKGSHSSNFFNNRNNGKEDDFVDFPQKPQQQRNYNTRGRQRPQNNFRNNYANNNNNNIQTFPTKPKDVPFEQSTTTSTTTTTFAPSTTTRFRSTPRNEFPYSGNVKTVSLQSSFRTAASQDTSSSDLGFYSSTTEALPFQRNSYQDNNGLFKSSTQQRVQPTTYSPPHSPFTGSSPSSDDFRPFEKTSTTLGEKFKQPVHNSFYNAQFENKATESYDQLRNQGIPNQSINYQPINRTTPNTNVFPQNVQKPNDQINAQGQTPFNEGQYSLNDRQNTFPQRQNSFNTRKPQPFDEKKNFNENPTEQLPAQNFGANPNNFEPQRSRRPNQNRGSNNYNKPGFSNEGNFGNPLSVRPLEIQIQTQTSTTTETPKASEQNNFGFGNGFRAPQRASPPFAPSNDNNTPTGFGFADLARASPSPFSLPAEQRRQPERAFNATKQNDRFAQNTFQALSSFNESPRGFSLTPPHQNQNQQQPRADNTTPFTSDAKKYDDKSYDNYTPATQAKKFSTLVPKDQYYPTTFRPATYKKVIQNYEQKIATSTKFAAASYLPTSTSTTARPQQANGNTDEDDGQYRPELYEKEFVRNKFKSRRPQQQVERTFNRRPVDPPTDTEDDEFLNTAHSLNIAAGANQLRAEKTKQSSPGAFRLAPTGPTITTSTTTTRKPVTQRSQKNTKSQHKNKKGNNEDASYDYAYYDSFSGNPQDYEYDLISEFGKTRKN